jgi:hypothetical protein
MLLFLLLHKSHLGLLAFTLLLGTISFLFLFRHFLEPLPEGLFHSLSEAPTLVAPSYLSHLITRFLLVENFTKKAKPNPLLQDKSQLGCNPRLEGKPHLPHHMDRTYLHPWPSIRTILSKTILTRLGGNSLKLALSYPLVQANHIRVHPILFGTQTLNPTPLFKGTTPTHTTLYITYLHTNNLICLALHIICKLLMVLQVYLWSSLPKVTSTHT